jgi:NADH-quinone oxidoreductase subunit F
VVGAAPGAVPRVRPAPPGHVECMDTSWSILPEQPIPSFDAYLDAGGGQGLKRALDMDPADVVVEVSRSGLRGRGGAGFPTGRKWASVREAAGDGDLHLVCNAAEGEPGTFKDRTLMVRDPYRLVEGLLIAAHATQARSATIATKARYTTELARLREAVEGARAAGWRGAEHLQVVEGPDEYLFGEETALLEVVEGKLPLPRTLPPYIRGLGGSTWQSNPTVVNNVETLMHAAGILASGAAAFRSVGTEEAPGTMVFTVVGDVEQPGVYELPLGTPLRTLVEDIAGARDPKAIYSGVSNAVITADLLDLPMDFDSFAEAGTGLGSAGFVVYGAHRCMVQVATMLARFLAVESCGQCPPCKLGSAAIFEHLDRLVEGEGTVADVEAIRQRVVSVTDARRCYLPVGTQLTIGSALEAFPEEFRARVGVRCPDEVRVGVPKIADIDHRTGAVTFDPEYLRKRGDWSYAGEAWAAPRADVVERHHAPGELAADRPEGGGVPAGGA